MAEVVINKPIEDELVESYLTYSMSVIVGRAIPDVRDGLKPVQRRILYGMMELGLSHKSSFKKSARIVGEVMGKYHPHGDAPVYEALVRMAQPFSTRYPLVDGQGNFGSIDRDPPAAMRYTEARLTKIAEEMLEDIDKETVDMIPNFDGSLFEPTVLPSKFPNLLANGSSGIAVGMTTNIPSHNLKELISALILLIKKPDATIEEIMKYLKGPDFPTGGVVINASNLLKIYSTGKGSIVIRGKVHVEEGKRDKKIVITEIPYMVSKASLIEQIAKYAQNNENVPIRNVRDESDKRGIRIVVEIPKNIDENIILNNLYKHTSLQDTYNVQMLVIDERKRPRLMNIKELLNAFINHRFQIIRRRAEYEYRTYSRRAHILEGLMKASRAIGTVVDIVRTSRTVEEAKKELMDVLEVTDAQADAILDMRLSRLTSLEFEKLQREYRNLIDKIEEVKEILEKDERVYDVMIREFEELGRKYGDERRTKLMDLEVRSYNLEDLIVEEDVVITLSLRGYLKSTPLKNYRLQRRGGKGVIGSKVSEGDEIIFVVVSKNKASTIFISNLGKAYMIKNYEIESSGRAAKGKHITAYLKLQDDEKIVALIPSNGEMGDLVLVTKKGKIKRTPLSEFARASTKGIRAISYEDEDDRVVAGGVLNKENSTILLATKKGFIIRFSANDLRRMGRSAMGVIGIKLSKNDEVVGMIIVPDEEGNVLTVTKKGFGKRTPVSMYRIQRRGGSGLKNISSVDKAGEIVGIGFVKGDEELIVLTKNGMSVRIPVSDIGVVGRITKGVKLIELVDDEIAQMAVVS